MSTALVVGRANGGYFWDRAKARLRAEVGDEVFDSWFAKMNLEGFENDIVRFSVLSSFLKSWIQNHYAERLLACLQTEDSNVARFEILVRSCVLGNKVTPKPEPKVPAKPSGNGCVAVAPISNPNVLEIFSGSPLDPGLTLKTKRVKIEDIQRLVARQYNVSKSDLLSSHRTGNVVRPRQIAMYLAKRVALRPLPEIGRRFGGRDHTTVLHAVNKIGWMIGERSSKPPSSVSKMFLDLPVDSALAEEIELLKRQLQE